MMKILENILYAYLDWTMRKIPPPRNEQNDELFNHQTPMTDYRTFTEFFDAHDFKHFQADEFTSYFHVTRRGVTNHEPPREMWGNIVKTLRIVDQLRDRIHRPVTILSSYRSPEYNRAIGDAAPKSLHMQFRALDIAASGYSPRAVFEILSAWRDQGQFKGGLGLYNTFVHIDTRGTNATWGV